MSLNFYAGIDSFKNDNKDNTAITLKVGEGGLDNLLDKLRELKSDAVVNITIESARIHYDKITDAETGQSMYYYSRNDEGVWEEHQTDDTHLELEGVDNTLTNPEAITADIVDRFLMNENYEYKPKSRFNPRKALVMISEGYSFDEVAKAQNVTTTKMLDELNAARDKFAPYAATWWSIEQAMKD